MNNVVSMPFLKAGMFKRFERREGLQATRRMKAANEALLILQDEELIKYISEKNQSAAYLNIERRKMDLVYNYKELFLSESDANEELAK